MRTVLCLLPLLVCLFLTACRTTSSKPRYPADPLFVRKTPVERKASIVCSTRVAHREVVPSQSLDTVVVAQRTRLRAQNGQ